MKKILSVIVLFLVFVGISSCETNNDPYNIAVRAKNGAGKEKKIDFNIEPWLVDSLKVSKDVLIRVAKDAAWRAPKSAKNELTYEFAQNEKFVKAHSIYTDGVLINVSVKGIAANSFNVKGIIRTHIDYDLNGNILLDENGFPIVNSYED